MTDSEMLTNAGGLIAWRRGHVSRLRQIDALERDAPLDLQTHGSFVALCQMLVERLGADDGVIAATDGSASAPHFSGPRSHRQIPGVGHDLPQEAPRAFADTVAELARNGKWRS